MSDKIAPLVPIYPENVIPITMWPFYFMRKVQRQINEAMGLTPEMLRGSRGPESRK